VVDKSAVAVLRRQRKHQRTDAAHKGSGGRAYVAVKVEHERRVPVLVVLAKEFLESSGRLPSVVMRDFGGDVVSDVGLGLQRKGSGSARGRVRRGRKRRRESQRKGGAEGSKHRGKEAQEREAQWEGGRPGQPERKTSLSREKDTHDAVPHVRPDEPKRVAVDSRQGALGKGPGVVPATAHVEISSGVARRAG
jgi:hypothetical protein